MYQVVVDYFSAPSWRGPLEEAAVARDRYARECGRIWKGGIRLVVLLKDGIVIAQASGSEVSR